MQELEHRPSDTASVSDIRLNWPTPNHKFGLYPNFVAALKPMIAGTIAEGSPAANTQLNFSW